MIDPTVRSANGLVRDPRLKGLLARVLTAAALIPIALGIVVWGGRAYSALIAFMLILLLFEWTRIVDRAEFSRGFYILSLTAIVAAVVGAGGEYALAIGLALAGGGVATLVEIRKAPFVPWALAGAAYLILPAVAALYLRHVPVEGRGLTLVLFATVWATDSGAYLFGTFLGGPRLWPRLSPKKTWAGAIGGSLCGGAAAAGVGLMTGLSDQPGALFLLGLVLGASAVIGDLLESALKRAFHVKDTGGAFPGHGGVLDRLDGFIVAVSVLAIMVGSGVLAGL
ncbi:MAG: phosphatidate cytidylyltransferase [Parvularcula sp.]